MKSLFGFFSRKSKIESRYPYDPEREKPVIRSSICTGEKVAGFRDRATGVFHDVMLIRDQSDLEEFLTAYGLDDGIDTEY